MYLSTGNSVYGYTVMNKSKHMDTQFCNDEEAQQLVNNPRFMCLEELENGSYEVRTCMFACVRVCVCVCVCVCV